MPMDYKYHLLTASNLVQIIKDSGYENPKNFRVYIKVVDKNGQYAQIPIWKTSREK